MLILDCRKKDKKAGNFRKTLFTRFSTGTKGMYSRLIIENSYDSKFDRRGCYASKLAISGGTCCIHLHLQRFRTSLFHKNYFQYREWHIVRVWLFMINYNPWNQYKLLWESIFRYDIIVFFCYLIASSHGELTFDDFMTICNVLPEAQLNEVLQFNIIPHDINEEALQRFEPQVRLIFEWPNYFFVCCLQSYCWVTCT